MTAVLVVLAAMVVVLASVAAMAAVRDWRRTGQLRGPTVVVVYAFWVSLIISVVLAAWRHVWPLPVASPLAWSVGVLLALVGVGMNAAGMDRFGSAAKVSGLDTGELVTEGIYRWSRNPQYVGSGLLLAAIALAGRSGAGLALTAVYIVGMRLYVPFEERHLERTFPDQYPGYRRRTHRWFGPPRTGR